MSATPSEAPFGPVAALAGTFTSPVATFGSLVKRPTWWRPFTISIVLVAISILAMTPKLDLDRTIREAFDRQAEKTGRTVSAAQIERATEMSRKFSALAVPFGTAGYAAFFFLAALALWVGARSFGAEAGFVQTLAIWSHANLANAAGVLVSIPIILGLPDSSLVQTEAERVVKSNVGAFLPDTVPSVLRAGASSLDLFSLVALALVIVGFRRLPGLSKGSATAVPIALWLVLIAVKMAFAALRS